MAGQRVVDSLMAYTEADPRDVICFLSSLVQTMPTVREYEGDGGASVSATAEVTLQLLAQPRWQKLRDYFAVTGVLAAYEAIPFLPPPREGE